MGLQILILFILIPAGITIMLQLWALQFLAGKYKLYLPVTSSEWALQFLAGKYGLPVRGRYKYLKLFIVIPAWYYNYATIMGATVSRWQV